MLFNSNEITLISFFFTCLKTTTIATLLISFNRIVQVASEVNEWRNKVQLLKQDLNTFHELFNDQFNKFYDKLTIINITNDTSSDDTTTATELTNNRLSISEYSVSSNFLSELETSFIECDLMDSLNSTNPQPTYPTTTVIEVIDQNESSTDKENIDPTQENKPSATTTTIKQTSANKASISLIKPRQSTVLPNAPVKKLKTLTIREPWKIATKVRPSKPKVKLTRIANNSSKRYNPDASVYEFDSKTEETSKLPKLNLRSSRMRF